MPVRTRRALVAPRRDVLVEHMEKSGKGVREVARDAEVDRSTVSRLRCVEGATTAKDTAERIARALGRELGDLFEHTDGTPLGGVA